jgi:hypothetical protein
VRKGGTKVYTRLLWELERRGKIKNEDIELCYEDGKIKILADRKVHVIKDNNTLTNLSNRNYKISKAVEDILRIFL